MAASAEQAVGPLAPTSVVDVQVMYEGALPPPYFHRVTDSTGQGANLAYGTEKSVSLWFVQHSDKDLGLAPVVDLLILKSQDSPDGYQIVKQELLRQESDSNKRFLGIKRRGTDDTGLGLGNLIVTYGSEVPSEYELCLLLLVPLYMHVFPGGEEWKEVCRISAQPNGKDVVIWGTDAEPGGYSSAALFARKFHRVSASHPAKSFLFSP